jgi:hypothetical protein
MLRHANQRLEGERLFIAKPAIMRRSFLKKEFSCYYVATIAARLPAIDSRSAYLSGTYATRDNSIKYPLQKNTIIVIDAVAGVRL